MEKIRQAIDTRLAGQHLPETVYDALCARPARRNRVRRADRKSTRLNSSHRL